MNDEFTVRLVIAPLQEWKLRLILAGLCLLGVLALAAACAGCRIVRRPKHPGINDRPWPPMRRLEAR